MRARYAANKILEATAPLKKMPLIKSSLIVFSRDTFHLKEGRLWSSPIASSSIRLFADNFREVGIVAHESASQPDASKCVQWPAQYRLFPIPAAKGILPRVGQFLTVLNLSRRLSKIYETAYVRMFSLEALPVALYFALLGRGPWFMSLHGDIEEAIAISWRQKSNLTRLILKKTMGFLARFTSNRPAILFVSGPALAHKYVPKRTDWLTFMDSGIRNEDLFKGRVDTCNAAPYKLMYAGEFSCRKGVDILLQSLAMLKKQGVQARLTLAGAGDRYWLDKLAKQLGIEEMLEFTGFLTYGVPLFAKMREADMLVVPSLGSEGWNRTITEANAQGLPIIATDVNSLGIAVREWSCGSVAPPGDPVSLAASIRRIIESAEERKVMISQSLKRGEYYIYEKEFARIRNKLDVTFSGRMRPVNEIDLSGAGR